MLYLNSFLKAGTAFLVLCLSLSSVAQAAAGEAREIFNARQIIAPPTADDGPDVQGDDGVNVQGDVYIGGIEQWVSVRSRHRNNPILLFLHGGPGFTSIPTSYYYMKGWEEYFTVVQWDQRGSGKTYLANDPKAISPTMNIDQMVNDAEDVVRYLQKTYKQKRIVLMADSWGTVLGLQLAQRHPDWFYVYVGMGQVVNVERGESLGYQATMSAAQADHNGQAVTELEAIAPFPDPQHPEQSLAKLKTERHWLEYYDGDADFEQVDIEDFSPDYSPEDLKAREAGLTYSMRALWVALSKVNFEATTSFACPVVFLEGKYDLTTPATLLLQWYGTLHAPYKRLVWFDDSAHMIDEEEPGKLLVSLVQDVLPLTDGRISAERD